MVLILRYISKKSDSIKEVLKIFKKVGKKRVCYVTLAKSCRVLQETFNKKKKGDDNVFFIDGISSMISIPKVVKGCNYVNAPYDLKSIAKEINKAIDAGYTYVIFDSISHLLSYGSFAPAGVNLLINFIKSFSEKLEEKKGNAIFVCDIEDKEKSLVEETVPVFDKVIGG